MLFSFLFLKLIMVFFFLLGSRMVRDLGSINRPVSSNCTVADITICWYWWNIKY